MTLSLKRVVAAPLVIACVILVNAPAGASAASFTSSAIAAPVTGAALFYDAGQQLGTVAVAGTVSPAITGTGTLVCYSAPVTYTVAGGIPITAGAFNVTVSLAAVAGQVCRLALVPGETFPQFGGSLAAFTGPVISVSEQLPLASNGQQFGYYLIAGTPTWSFAFGGDGLGTCPIDASDATDPNNYGSYSLFFGDACLPALSGGPPNPATRSAIQISGLNAYPPGSIPLLTSRPGFQPISFGTAWDPTHDTVTVSETDTLMECAAPGGYPPILSNCPSLVPAGMQLQQSTTLEPGGQVARVTQTFNDLDSTAHTVDLLFSQAAHAYMNGGQPGFEFPSQAQFATHAAPDTYGPFPTGPGSVYVIANAAGAPAASNPVGAITYSSPPQSASFINSRTAQTSTFLMHYVESVPAGGSVTLQWSFSQADSVAALGPLVQLEIDRFYTPTITVASPAEGLTVHTPAVTVSGQAYDPEGISAVVINGLTATVSPGGGFTAQVPVRLGANTIQITATNLAGVTSTAERFVVVTPVPCIVPRLGGRTLARARRMLSADGCSAGKVVRVHSRRVKRGHVVSTTPRAGTRRTHGTRVRISLSSGDQRAKQPSHRRRRPSKPSHRGRSGQA